MFFRNLLLLLVAYLLWRFISKAWRFRKLVINQRDEFLNQTRAAEKQTRQDGEINIQSSKKTKPSTSDDGTYIDYEEVD
ncbi:MAG: hypothetical protein KC517_04290 [Bacteroidetes bacterium]|jgi:hypothetical protein|nr:hypothetical protein [Bacteroidota bacterium]